MESSVSRLKDAGPIIRQLEARLFRSNPLGFRDEDRENADHAPNVGTVAARDNPKLRNSGRNRRFRDNGVPEPSLGTRTSQRVNRERTRCSVRRYNVLKNRTRSRRKFISEALYPSCVRRTRPDRSRTTSAGTPVKPKAECAFPPKS